MKLKTIFTALIGSAFLTSCFCDKVAVGNVSPTDELVHVYSTHNDHFIAGAVVTHDKASKHMQGIDDYVIEYKTTFGDIMVGALTGGIYTPTTVKYYVPKSNPKVVVEKQKFKSKAYKGYLK